MAFGLWDVSCKTLVIPGTRKTASFGPIRIADRDRQTASKHLAKMLNEHFSRDLRGDHKFSDHFALYNMQWADHIPAIPMPAELSPIHFDDRNDPPTMEKVI